MTFFRRFLHNFERQLHRPGPTTTIFEYLREPCNHIRVAIVYACEGRCRGVLVDHTRCSEPIKFYMSNLIRKTHHSLASLGIDHYQNPFAPIHNMKLLHFNVLTSTNAKPNQHSSLDVQNSCVASECSTEGKLVHQLGTGVLRPTLFKISSTSPPL